MSRFFHIFSRFFLSGPRRGRRAVAFRAPW